MNKIFKSALTAIAAIVGLSMTSCTDKYEYNPDTTSGQQVYFDQVAGGIVALSLDASSFDVNLMRVNADAPATFNVTSTDESGLFTIPSTVSFAAGSNTAALTIGYDPTKLVYDDFKTIELTIEDPANTTPYGISKLSFQAGVPSPFVTIGKAKFMDSWMYDDVTYFDVVLQQNEINHDIYRIVNPYDEILVDGGYTASNVKKGPSEYLTFQIRHAGEEVGGAVLTQEGLVTFEPFRTGYYIPSYDNGEADGEVWGFHVSNEQFHESWHVEAAYLKSYVMAYKEDGTPGQIALAPWYYIIGLGGWNQTQEDRQIEIIFPGFTPSDFSSELTYNGIFTNPDNEVFAVGNLTLGADAETVKAIVMSADDDAEAVADAIAAGDLEAYDVKAGRIEVPITEGLTGKLQLIVVVIDGETVKSVSAAPFEYYGGGGNPWQSLGVGYLTDNFFIVNFYKNAETEEIWTPQTYEVEIYENTNEPGVYRIINAFEGAMKLIAGEAYTDYYEPSNMEINAADAQGVYFYAQPVGYSGQTVSSYGGYLIGSGQATFEQLKQIGGYLGTLENGVITLPQIPYYDENDQPTGEYYQGVRNTSSGTRYAGWMDDGIEFKVVLPGAAASVKAKYASKARAARFENRLNAYSLRENSKQAKLVKGKVNRKFIGPKTRKPIQRR